MWETVKWLVSLYIPPKPGDNEHLMRYQIAQSVGILGIWVLAWGVGIWLIGRAPFLPQVAWAQEVQAVAVKADNLSKDNTNIWNKLTDIQLLQLQTSIASQVKNACLAQRSHNQADLDNANSQVSQQTDMYFTLAGRPFNLPSCSTILVEGH